MDEEYYSLIGFCVVLLLLFGVAIGLSYHLGKVTERHNLHAALVQTIKDAYWDGYTDAIRRDLNG